MNTVNGNSTGAAFGPLGPALVGASWPVTSPSCASEPALSAACRQLYGYDVEAETAIATVGLRSKSP